MAWDGNAIWWRDKPSYQLASDLFHFARLIHECRPDWVIETGGGGGTTEFLVDVCLLEGHGVVLGIPEDSIKRAKDLSLEGSRMAILDSDVYDAQYMLDELLAYAPLITSKQHLVVCHTDREDWGSAPALRAFLKDHSAEFETIAPPDPTMNTYLRRT